MEAIGGGGRMGFIVLRIIILPGLGLWAAQPFLPNALWEELRNTVHSWLNSFFGCGCAALGALRAD
jgi:hypothetical protein